MPTKIELIVDNQDDNDALDKQWPGLLQLARALPGLERLESGEGLAEGGRLADPAHRSLLLYFPSYDSASAAVAGPEGGAFFQAFFPAVNGKVTALFTDIEES